MGNDLERATELARRMVCEWGMSDAMGPLAFGKQEEQIFLGYEIARHQDYSEERAVRIDEEVKRFVTDSYTRAHAVLRGHKQKLVDLADALLVRETLDAEQVRRIAEGLPLEVFTPAAGPTPAPPPEPKATKEKKRPAIVPPLSPRPVPQE